MWWFKSTAIAAAATLWISGPAKAQDQNPRIAHVDGYRVAVYEDAVWKFDAYRCTGKSKISLEDALREALRVMAEECRGSNCAVRPVGQCGKAGKVRVTGFEFQRLDKAEFELSHSKAWRYMRLVCKSFGQRSATRPRAESPHSTRNPGVALFEGSCESKR